MLLRWWQRYFSFISCLHTAAQPNVSTTKCVALAVHTV